MLSSLASLALAQTTAGTSATIVVPVIAQTANVASGTASFAAGRSANANQDGCLLFVYWQSRTGADCFGTSHQFRMMGSHGPSIDYGTRLAGGNGDRWAVIGDTVAGKTFATWTGAYLSDGGAWVNASDRNLKTDFHAIDSLQIPAKSMRCRSRSGATRRKGTSFISVRWRRTSMRRSASAPTTGTLRPSTRPASPSLRSRPASTPAAARRRDRRIAPSAVSHRNAAANADSDASNRRQAEPA